MLKYIYSYKITHCWYPATGAAVGIPGQPRRVFRPSGSGGRAELGWRWNPAAAGAVGWLVGSPQVQQLEAPGWILPEEARPWSLYTETLFFSIFIIIHQRGAAIVKYYAWLVQEPWYCQRQERRAKTAGSTDSPTLCPHMGSLWTSLQGHQRWQRSTQVQVHALHRQN